MVWQKHYRRESGSAVSGLLAGFVNLVPCSEFLIIRHQISDIKVSDIGVGCFLTVFVCIRSCLLSPGRA